MSNKKINKNINNNQNNKNSNLNNKSAEKTESKFKTSMKDLSKELSDHSIHTLSDEHIKKIDEHHGVFKEIFSWMIRHFFITFISLYGLTTIAIIFNQEFLSIIGVMALVTYVIVYLSKTIRTNVYKFMHNELKLKQILTGYVSTIIALIGLFAIIYWGVTGTGFGYIKYGSCANSNIVTSSMIANDPGTVHEILNYAYFSAMTFLTVGFGDICPMGASKVVTMIEALAGNVFTLLILAIAVSNYNQNKESK